MRIYTYIIFFMVMALMVLVFPYIMTVFSRFNKDKVSVWRRFFTIISTCYLPFIIILAIAWAYQVDYRHHDPLILNVSGHLFKTLFLIYYFIFLVSGSLIKRRINLQLNYGVFLAISSLYYFVVTLFLPELLYFCNDPLSRISAMS